MFEDSAFLVAVSMSYICLFFVLTFFNYEVIFRTGVILVAATGFFFPILYGLPYIIILWRILVGLNVATDQKLYIARCIEQIDMDKADFSGSTTLNHWAVVIQDSGGYFYTHAVGNVVHLVEEKRFRLKKWKRIKYPNTVSTMSALSLEIREKRKPESLWMPSRWCLVTLVRSMQ